MARIVWDDSFSVKVQEIDEQHKKWISIINDLHDTLMAGKGLNEITGKSLKAMEEYGAFHFDFEEKYMEKIGYPDIDGHKKEHQKFLEKIRALIKDEEDGKLILNTEIMQVLMDWLTNHILKSDKKYSPQA